MASSLVTVFGGSGFLGREIVKHLVAAGHRVRVGVRRPEVLSQLGRDGCVEAMHADVSNESTVANAVEGADWVVNSVGHYVVEDVAEACARALADPSTVGRVCELGGADVLAYRELVQLLLERMGWRRIIFPVPFGAWDILAGAMTWHPNAPLTRDQVNLLKSDNVVAEGALTLEDLGIRTVRVEDVLPACIG